MLTAEENNHVFCAISSRGCIARGYDNWGGGTRRGKNKQERERGTYWGVTVMSTHQGLHTEELMATC